MEETTETTNLWNKKAVDLTVSDNVKLAVLTPILAMAGLAAAGAATNAIKTGVKKFRKAEVTTQPTEPTEQ